MASFIDKLSSNPLLGNPLFWLGAIMVQMIILFLYYPVIERRIGFIGSRFFGSGPLGIYYVFFIGTAIHELSHLLACLFLWVRVGKVNFFGPKMDKNGEGATLGYVEHAICDPFRGTLIGIAPIFGSAIFTYLMFVWISPNLSIFSIPNFSQLSEALIYMVQHLFTFKVLVFLYIVIACAMSGNPSKADLQSVPIAIGAMAVFGILLFLGKNLVNWNAIGGAASQASFLAPPIMLISMIMGFEMIILFIIQIITGFIMRSWGYRAI